MERFIRLTFVTLAAVLGVTGLMLTGAVAGPANGADEQVALKRDEDDGEVLVADEDDDDFWKGDDGTSHSASWSRDRSRDVTTADRSRSLDRSRDRTGDGVGALDRSYSRDRSLDRTGDHNTPDVSRSRDASADQTSGDGGGTDDDTDD
jgi:hypothetical protein